MASFQKIFPTAAIFAYLMSAAPVLASNWQFETEDGRDFVAYTPKDIDTGPAPLVIVYHDQIQSPRDVAKDFPLYETASQGKFKILYLGAEIGTLNSATMTRAEQSKLLGYTHAQTTAAGVASPDGVFLIGFGASVPGLFEFACQNPGKIRGVVGIDYEGQPIACTNATGTVAIAIHSGKETKEWTEGTQSSRDYSSELAMIETFRTAGGRVNEIPLKGDETLYPGFAAYFHEQTGTSLQDVVAYFVERALASNASNTAR